MTTERVECTFVVKEGTHSQPYIQVEPTVAGLDIAFALREGTTLETAHDLARRMRNVGFGSMRRPEQMLQRA
jgi:hypothetical protein